MLTLTLPYAPALNHYWRHVGAKVLISAAGRRYRLSVLAALAAAGFPKAPPGRLAVSIDLHPPDRRRRDLDNAPKAILDAATHGGVWEDDSLIDDLRIRRRGVVPGGKVVVTIRSMGGDRA